VALAEQSGELRGARVLDCLDDPKAMSLLIDAAATLIDPGFITAAAEALEPADIIIGLTQTESQRRSTTPSLNSFSKLTPFALNRFLEIQAIE
jgi:hypothetical protein